MKYTDIIKEEGRGKDGATDLPEDLAYELYDHMLRGAVRPEPPNGAAIGPASIAAWKRCADSMSGKMNERRASRLSADADTAGPSDCASPATEP